MSGSRFDTYDDEEDTPRRDIPGARQGAYRSTTMPVNLPKRAQRGHDENAIVPVEGGGFIYKRFRVTETALLIPEDTNQDEWDELGSVLNNLNSVIQWAVGDWAVFGANRVNDWVPDDGDNDFETKYQYLLDNTNYKYQTLRDYAYVASNIPVSIRNRHVSFSHHRVVAPMDNPELQAKWIHVAEFANWTVEDMKTAVSYFKHFYENGLPIFETHMEWLDWIEVAQPTLDQLKQEIQDKTGFNLKPEPVSPLATEVSKKTFNKVWKALASGKPIKKDDIANLRKWLDEVERKL